MEIPLRRNRGEFQRPPQGEFRALAARKSDDTAEKVQPAANSEHFRSAPRTCQLPRGRLNVQWVSVVGGHSSAGGRPMSDMRRREFIALVGGGSLLLAAKIRRALGQQSAKIPRIGILDDAPMWQPFRQALRELGYVEGQNIAYEYRYGEGAPDRLATVAAELVRRPADLIATYGTAATYAAKEATATIPIVMIGVGDPVRSGLVASLARPGGNITGNTVLSPDLGPKRLQILREVIAKVKRVIYLANPDNASNVAALAQTKIAASAAGTVLIPVEVRAVGDFEPAFAAIMRERPDAILVSNDPFHQLHVGRIIEFLTKNRLPGMFQSKEGVVAGGFIGYAPNLPDLFRRAAGYVHKILQGPNPAGLPVELPTKFDLAVNLKSAKALGLELTPTFIARADEVIE